MKIILFIAFFSLALQAKEKGLCERLAAEAWTYLEEIKTAADCDALIAKFKHCTSADNKIELDDVKRTCAETIRCRDFDRAHESKGKKTLFESAKNFDDCEQIAKKFEGCGGGPGATYLGDEHSSCYKTLLDQALDRRLLRLKKENPPQFKKEMQLQRDFNQMLSPSCAVNEASGVSYGWKLELFACERHLYTWRMQIAQQMEQSSLEISCPQGPLRMSPKARTFAQGLCQLPKDVWKNKSALLDCERTLLKCFSQS